MNKHKDAKLLLKALTDVDDKYILEAAENAANSGENHAADEVIAVSGGIISIKNAVRLIAAAAACAALAFAGSEFIKTGDPADDELHMQAENPVLEVSSIKEAEQITGFGFDYGIDKEIYSKETIVVLNGNMIEVNFANEEGDQGYYIRKSSSEGDISGDHNDYNVTEKVMIDGREVTLKGDGSSWSAAVWNDGGYAYAVGCQSQPLSLDEMTNVIKEMK